MAPAATAGAPAVPHAPELSRVARLGLFEEMARSRQARRQVAAERARRRMPPLNGAASPGWEALEAAAARTLRSGDALAAGAEWPGPHTAARRVGGTCRLTEMVSAGLGATIGAAPGTVVVALAGPAWGAGETAALTTAVRRRAPLVVLLAAPGEAAVAAQAAAATAGAVFEKVSAADVEVCVLAVDSASTSARAGKGPTLIACARIPSDGRGRSRRQRHPLADDPVERYAARLGELGISAGELGEVARGARPTQ